MYWTHICNCWLKPSYSEKTEKKCRSVNFPESGEPLILSLAVSGDKAGMGLGAGSVRIRQYWGRISLAVVRTVVIHVCKCHIRQNRYAEWIFFPSVCLFFRVARFSELYLTAGWIAWMLQREQAGASGLLEKMCPRVNISYHFSEGFGLCLLGKELSAWVASLQGRRWIPRQESSGCVLAKGRNSASLPLQWASQQKLAQLCPPVDVICSTLY